jgi:hypothetical protein
MLRHVITIEVTARADDPTEVREIATEIARAGMAALPAEQLARVEKLLIAGTLTLRPSR